MRDRFLNNGFFCREYDRFTGALTRDVFEVHAKEKFALSGTYPRHYFFDVDGLKDVNDTLGHDAGDEILSALAVAV